MISFLWFKQMFLIHILFVYFGLLTVIYFFSGENETSLSFPLHLYTL